MPKHRNRRYSELLGKEANGGKVVASDSGESLAGSIPVLSAHSGVEKWSSRQPHKLEIAGSNPAHRHQFGVVTWHGAGRSFEARGHYGVGFDSSRLRSMK